MILYSTKPTMKTFTSSQLASPLSWVPIKRIPKRHPGYFRLSSLFNRLLFSDACFSTSWLSCFSTSWRSLERSMYKGVCDPPNWPVFKQGFQPKAQQNVTLFGSRAAAGIISTHDVTLQWEGFHNECDWCPYLNKNKSHMDKPCPVKSGKKESQWGPTFPESTRRIKESFSPGLPRYNNPKAIVMSDVTLQAGHKTYFFVFYPTIYSTQSNIFWKL